MTFQIRNPMASISLAAALLAFAGLSSGCWDHWDGSCYRRGKCDPNAGGVAGDAGDSGAGVGDSGGTSGSTGGSTGGAGRVRTAATGRHR